MAEGVEKVRWRVARGIARFDFARDEWHQRSSQRPYAPSVQGLGLLCRSLRIDNAYRRSVGKKFRAMRLQATFSTASATNGSLSHAVRTSAYPPTSDIQNGDVRFVTEFVCSTPRSRHSLGHHGLSVLTQSGHSGRPAVRKPSTTRARCSGLA